MFSAYDLPHMYVCVPCNVYTSYVLNAHSDIYGYSMFVLLITLLSWNWRVANGHWALKRHHIVPFYYKDIGLNTGILQKHLFPNTFQCNMFHVLTIIIRNMNTQSYCSLNLCLKTPITWKSDIYLTYNMLCLALIFTQSTLFSQDLSSG